VIEPANSDATGDMPAEEALDHHAIAAALTQQAPFVLVDRVRALTEGRRIVAIKNVSLTDPYFRGHFPGNPILPGVLICEALAQAATLLVRRSPESIPVGSTLVLTGLDRVRFRRPVVPGEQLVLDVTLSERRDRRWLLHGVARVDDHVAAEADIALTAVAEESLR
jgi:3-hydroxyacyl-[acyl-carrier-protein] dehydratase